MTPGIRRLMPGVNGWEGVEFGLHYEVTADNWRSFQWVKSIREVTQMFNENGVQVSASTVHAIQAQRDDRAMGRPNTRAIRPLPKWAQFRAVGVRGERYW